MNKLTQARVKALFDYNPETGDLVWRPRPEDDFRTRRGWSIYNAQCLGKVASATSGNATNQYRVVRIDGWLYQQHHVVWLWQTGKMPDGLIDHRDCDGTNNRWINLREAVYAQNHANRRYQQRTASGLKGAFYDKQRNLWISKIGYQGKGLYLGGFPTPEEAHAAYMDAAQKYYGEFARSG